MSAAGTLLPARMADEAAGWRAELARGKAAFGVTFVRLLGGWASCILAAYALSRALSGLHGSFIVGSAASAVTNLVVAFSVVMLAVILSQACLTAKQKGRPLGTAPRHSI